MKLRNNKGFAVIDISIALIIIILLIPTIFGIVYNVQKSNNSVKRKATALNIATDILEIAKAVGYNNISLENSTFLDTLNQRYEKSDYEDSSLKKENYNYIYYSTTGENEEHYQIQIGVLNKAEEGNSKKIVEVVVIYPVGNKQETIDISTAIKN